MTTLTVPRRFNGPPESANGGWFSGALAGLVGAPVVRVRLLAPPPLETPLEVTRDGDRVASASPAGPVATAEPGERFEFEVGDPVTFADAQAVGPAYGGLVEHPFPTCFSCGTAREDGLKLQPAAVTDGAYAAAWTAAEVTPEIVWSALDCPGGWAAGFGGRPMVLGTMTGTLAGLPETGEECVIMAWPRGGGGRKFFSSSALFGADQRLLAHAEAVWIHIDPAAIRPR